MLHKRIDQLQLTAVDQSTLREFVSAWAQHRNPVLFVGAGLSKFESVRRRDVPSTSRFGSWQDLASEFHSGLTGNDPKLDKLLPSDPLRLAQVYEAQFGRAALLDLVAKHVPSSDFLPGPAHRQLREISWAAVVTTNYDDLLERSFNPMRKVRPVVTDEDLTQPRTPDDLLIVKMHGDLSRRDSIVISEEDYRQYAATRPGISVKVRQLLVEHPLLFIGFSMTDPHFATIDGWIRDTVRAVRLPAIAVVHDDPLPAAHTMWKARGIELIRLGKSDEVAHLVAALAHEARPRSTRRRNAINERVHALIETAYTAIRAERTDASGELAKIIVKIVDGARHDADEGQAAREEIRWFCAGWHNVLGIRELLMERANPPKTRQISMRDVLTQIDDTSRRHIYHFALEAGFGDIRVDATNTIDIAAELLKDSHSTEERARIHLFSARILLSTGRTTDAQQAIAAGRAERPGATIAALLSAEVREVLFQAGDAKQIAEELRSPPDEESDVHAMCRRGADSLLLGDARSALRWYSEALERATNGDESYAALWGQIAASRESLSTTVGETEEETLTLERIRAISDPQKPKTAAADECLARAGEIMLEGRSDEFAVEQLLEFLTAARHLGWPHSPQHNISYRIESTAFQVSKLLIKLGESNPQRIKEALTQLCRYGLAHQIPQLFTYSQIELLATRTADIQWFRDFCRERPTVLRSADARFTTAICGLSLLDDATIEAVIDDLVRRTENGKDISLLGDLWGRVHQVSEHLPGNSARLVMKTVTKHLSNRGLMFRIAPDRIVPGLWRQQGFLNKGGPESRELARAARMAFLDATTKKDSFWLRSITGLLTNAANSRLFSDEDRDALAAQVAACLTDILSVDPIDSHQALQLVELLSALESKGAIKVFTKHANDVVRGDINSSTLPLALHCATLAMKQMTHIELESLLNTLSEIAENALGLDHVWDVAGPLGRAFAELISLLPRQRAPILKQLIALAERDSSALVGLGNVKRLLSQQAKHAAQLAERSLFTGRRALNVRLWQLSSWLKTAHAAAAALPVLDALVGLCMAEAPDTRIAAVSALTTFFVAHPNRGASRRHRAFQTCLAVSVSDSNTRVRARALNALRYLARTSAEKTAIRRSLSARDEPLVALERRLVGLLLSSADDRFGPPQ